MVDTLNVWDEPVTTRWKSCEVHFGFNGQMFVIPNHLLKHDAAYGVHWLLAGLPIHQACECLNTAYNLWLYIPVITKFPKKMTPYIQNEFYWSVSAHNQLVTELGLMEIFSSEGCMVLGMALKFLHRPNFALALESTGHILTSEYILAQNWSAVIISKWFGHFTDVDDLAMLSSSRIQGYGERNAVGMM